MNFAIVGLDTRISPLAQSISELPEHQLVFACVDRSMNARYAEVLTRFDDDVLYDTNDRDWLARLHASSPDVVVVAAGQDSTALVHAIRRLSELGIPLVLSHPLNHSAMVYYELEILIEDAKVAMIPYVPARSQTAVQVLRRRMDDQPVGDGVEGLGQLEQITLDRTVGKITRAELLDAFTSDVDVIRYLVGDVSDVAAMHPGGADSLPIPLSVQMNSKRGHLLRWSMSAAAAPPGAKLTLTGTQGSSVLHMPDEDAWQLEGLVSDEDPAVGEESAGGSSDVVASLIRQLEMARNDAEYMQQTWQDVTRSVETTEALEKSLRKGRVVRLSYDGRGEQAAFKGTMASIGCGLLIAMLLVTVVSAVLLKIAKVQEMAGLAAFVGKVPYVVLGLLLVFLILQLLRFAIPGKE
ncbi:MAG: hypothetical protein WBF93_04935 [Pirellulales bacterium]